MTTTLPRPALAFVALLYPFIVQGDPSPEAFITLSPLVVESVQRESPLEGTGLLDQVPTRLEAFGGSLADQLDGRIGISLQRRGLHSLEPTIQGMGFDRVTSSLNGIYLPNASPTRTGSPLNYLGATGQLGVDVIRSLPSVTHGPVPTGSRILIESRDFRPAGWDGRIRVGENQDRTGVLTARVRVAHNPFSLGFHHAENGDYPGGGESGVVDADYKAWGFLFDGMLYMGDSHATAVTTNYFRQDLSRNASLPLDTKDTTSIVLTLNHAISLESGIIGIRAGYTLTEPFLTSEDRVITPAAPVQLVESKGEARSYTIGIDWSPAVAGSYEAILGVDSSWQNRNMLRSRHLNSGAVLHDLIWPDIAVYQAGGFAELRSNRQPSLNWRLGARVDKVTSRSKAADSPVVGVPGARGNTIRENFIAFHGPGAATVEGDDWTGAVNGILDYVVTEQLSLHGGVGYTVAAAGPGERYRSFVNALGGGVEIGNPALKRERKLEFQAGASWKGDVVCFSTTAFYMEVEDFAGRELLTAEPVIYSFKNKDARFMGVHAAMELVLVGGIASGASRAPDTNPRLSLPISVSVTRGEDMNSGRLLPEVPPLEASMAICYSGSMPAWGLDYDLRLSCRHVAAKNNPQPDLNPIFADSDAYTLLDFEWIFNWKDGWSLALRADNLLDREAYAYLQPPVAAGSMAPSSGSLSGGDRIPLPGRHLLVTLAFSY